MGNVMDVAFAHSEDVIIAAIDEMGNLFVYTLESAPDGKIVYPLEFGLLCLCLFFFFGGRGGWLVACL